MSFSCHFLGFLSLILSNTHVDLTLAQTRWKNLTADDIGDMPLTHFHEYRGVYAQEPDLLWIVK